MKVTSTKIEPRKKKTQNFKLKNIPKTIILSKKIWQTFSVIMSKYSDLCNQEMVNILYCFLL